MHNFEMKRPSAAQLQHLSAVLCDLPCDTISEELAALLPEVLPMRLSVTSITNKLVSTKEARSILTYSC